MDFYGLKKSFKLGFIAKTWADFPEGIFENLKGHFQEQTEKRYCALKSWKLYGF
jgi:hypothetical protein